MDAEGLQFVVHVTNVQFGCEPAVTGVDQDEAVGGLHEQRRDAARQLSLGVEVRAHELALDVIVVPLEDESRRDGPPSIDQDMAGDAVRIQSAVGLAHRAMLRDTSAVDLRSRRQ
jgi:hypothetical protein